MTIVTPAYGRHKLTRKVKDYYTRAGRELVVVESAKDGKLSGVESHTCHNEPLGRKFNRSIQLGTGCEGDALVVGSDCLLSLEYMLWLDTNMPKETSVTHHEVWGCHFFNSASGEMVFIRHFNCGSGKFMKQEMLKECGYAPYNAALNYDIDSSTRNHMIGPRSYTQAEEDEPICIEIRTGDNMWGWDWVGAQGGGIRMNADRVFAAIGEEKEDWMGLG